jgi:hypothetical protein
MSYPVATYPYAHAGEFVEALRPHHAHWRPSPSRWIFRGQWDSQFALLPSAFRRESWEPFAAPGESPFNPDTPAFGGEQTLQEYRVLRRFFDRLDFAGVDVPNEMYVRTYLDHVENALAAGGLHDHRQFLTDPAIATFAALAQHHGVPTRMLDWTRTGLHAAYFAGQEAARRASAEGSLAVWALSRDFVQDTNGSADMGSGIPHVQILTAPRGSNPNLHAQAGLFAAWFELNAISALEARIPRLIAALPARKKNIWASTSPLLQFTLPHSEAPILLRMLSYENIDGSHMFPGRDGVVRAMKEFRFWDRTD